LFFFFFGLFFFLGFSSKSFAAWPVVFQTHPNGVLYLVLLEWYGRAQAIVGDSEG
jgi:hypothetical protein